MFSKAVAIAAEFTRPVIISTRLENQQVNCGMATFIMINDKGWAITAAHVVQDALTAQQHKKETSTSRQWMQLTLMPPIAQARKNTKLIN